MRFTKDSIDGAPITALTGSFSFTDLVEGEDYTIYEETEMNGIKTIFFSADGDGRDSLNVEGATNIFQQNDIMIGFTEDDLGFIPANCYFPMYQNVHGLPLGGPEPEDWNIGRQFWYYKVVISGDEEADYKFARFALCGRYENYNPETQYFEIRDLSNILYLPNKNCFGLGKIIMPATISAHGQVNSVELIADIFTEFASTGSASVTDGYWAPHKRGVTGNSMLDAGGWFAAPTNMFNDKIYNTQQSAIPTAPTDRLSAYIVGFNYEDEDYIGVAAVKKDSQGLIQSCAIWGAGMEFWVDKGSSDYFIDAEGAIKKSNNPNYVRSGWNPLGKSLPSAEANPILHSMGGEVTIGGIRSGWKSYIFTKIDYDTFIGEIFNPKITTFTGPTEGLDFFAGMSRTTASVSSSLISVYTLPLDIAYLSREFDSTKNCRSGGVNSSLSEYGRVLNDRIVQLNFISGDIFRKARYLDFTNTSMELFLPFIGFVPINVQEIFFPENPADVTELYLTYQIDVLTGNFTVIFGVGRPGVSGTARMTFSANGNMMCPYPIIGEASSFERISSGISSAVKGAINVVAQANAGNPYGAATSAISTAESVSNEIGQNRAYAQLGGSPEMVSGMYIPYLKIERPITPQMTFTGRSGYMSAVTGKVGEVQTKEDGVMYTTGFNSYRSVDVTGITTATEAEKAEIESLLMSGIWITRGEE